MHVLTPALDVFAGLIVGWLPGAMLFRAPILDRERRAALDVEERIFWQVVLSIVLSLSIVLALAALGAYRFRWLLAIDLGVALAIAAIWRERLRMVAARPGFSSMIPLALVGIGMWQFFPPSEYVIGGKDPGVYMNEGVQIAQRGALVISDPVVASVPPFARDLFFPSHQRMEQDYYGLRFMGFFITDPGSGAVVGQFPHLFPASIAVGYGLDGLTGARRTTGVWALVGLLAVYFTGARLFGRAAAASACLLLALNVVQVWFARYPNAEVVMQAFLFAAVLASTRAHVDGDPFFAPVAAALLGLLLFLRFDAVLGIAAIGAAVAASRFHGGRFHGSFVVALGLIAAAATVYMLGPLRPYAARPVLYFQTLPGWQGLIIVVTAAMALLAAVAAPRSPRISAAMTRWLPMILAVVVAGAALYALFLREQAGKLAAHDAYSMRTFAQAYVTVPALLAAIAGFCILALRSFWRMPPFFMTVAVFGFFFFYKLRIVPEHFWMGRRFLPVVLPATMMCVAAAALTQFTDRRWMRWVHAVVGLAFVVLLGAQYWRASAPIVAHVEYAGLIPRLEQLAGRVADDELLIGESRNAGSDVHVLALPLAYVYARNVLLLDSPRPDKGTFSAFLEWAHTRYSRVLFMGSGGTDLLSNRYGVESILSDSFQVSEYATTPWNLYPRGVRQKEFDFGLYAFTPPVRHDGQWFDLDLGVKDDLHVLRFHAKEASAGRTFRWTQATSYVAITVIQPGARTVVLTMNNGGRPAAAPPADVSVSLHGQLLGTVRVGDQFAPYELRIPPELAARAAALGDPVELKLVTALWNPHEVLGSPDDRNLGVMVDRVTVK